MNRAEQPKLEAHNGAITGILPLFKPQSFPPMLTLISTLLPAAAVGYSLIYLLFGGGIFGAIVIFIIAKIFGK